jgi:glycosyltransferase involved in cell wall biosynthesis
MFGCSLAAFIEDKNAIELIHYRDIWSGLAVLGRERTYKTVFEVNALPSIELPYRYPLLGKVQLNKIRDLEIFVLQKSDAIVCPAESIKNNLVQLEIPESKITVITNGAETDLAMAPVADMPENYILYFGALQYWQGVDDLLKAFAGLKDFTDLKLVICSSNRSVFSKPYRKLAEKLGIGSSVLWYYQLPKDELNTLIKLARLTIAPFKETERNLNQGFSPLKIFESMALGTPVLASDLPSVREIITDKKDGCMVRPDRPAELSRAIRFLLDYPEYAKEIGLQGRQTMENDFSWKEKTNELKRLYANLINFEYQ